MQEILSSEKGQKSVSNSEVEAGEAGTGLSESLVLICDMTVRWTGSSINLDLSYLEGEAGREKRRGGAWSWSSSTSRLVESFELLELV